MGYLNLQQLIPDLQRNGHLLVCSAPVRAQLEVAEIQRRCYANRGPAVLFTNVEHCRFPMVSNLYGSLERARFIFRDTIEPVKRAIELKLNPEVLFKQPARYWRAPLTALNMRPRRTRRGPLMANECQLRDLPQHISWPDDGGPFVTLPQVYSELITEPGLNKSNLGMYRVQLGGNDYRPDQEVGLHYQIHRGIGVHHQAALAAGKPFRVNIFVGGAPAMTVAAVMPLPEGMTELGFAGALAGHRIAMIAWNQTHLYAEADFCISGIVDPHRQKPEGPFGDHLGYYSLKHEFPVLQVDRVFHRPDAIWPFTVVGRPPQEDTTFGELIHEITGPILPTVLPGVRSVHAVDAAGVHPLLLAVGSERYVPYRPTDRPAEILTQAHAILGQGQLSLAKYLFIIDQAAADDLHADQIERFFQIHLERVDWRRDLHFQTQTTIDTLDYSGTGFNQGSKVIIAAAGPAIRRLSQELPSQFRLPDGYRDPTWAMPGVLAVSGPPYSHREHGRGVPELIDLWESTEWDREIPLVVICDDAQFAAKSLVNWLWVTFTRSNPATDIHGVGAKIVNKHWGCRGSLIIDARIKPYHAPPLIESAEVQKRVDALAAQGGPLAKYL